MYVCVTRSGRRWVVAEKEHKHGDFAEGQERSHGEHEGDFAEGQEEAHDDEHKHGDFAEGQERSHDEDEP